MCSDARLSDPHQGDIEPQQGSICSSGNHRTDTGSVVVSEASHLPWALRPRRYSMVPAGQGHSALLPE